VILRKEVAIGHVAKTLLDRSANQSALVVGRRGFGRFVRLLIGSTSLDVASRSLVPVIVVPDPWSMDEHQSEPVVVGVDRGQLQPDVLQFAFTQARLRHVPLIAAHGRDESADEGSPPAGGGVETDLDGRLEEALETYAKASPEVEMSFVDHPAHPLSVLLDEVGPGQLLVLGRHRGGRREGFPFGSVAHSVLHYADVPVAIVPPGS
jgi:nucleotide-binding universal stress UspA family protein